MTRYLLDADIAIDRLDRLPAVVDVVGGLASDGIAISVVSYMEIRHGILRRHDSAAGLSALRVLLAGLAHLEVTLEIGTRCAEIRADLQRRGGSIRPRALDLLIAATAIEHDLTLVTRNVADYGDVPGLRLLTPPGGHAAGA